jgi:hypothetical protein
MTPILNAVILIISEDTSFIPILIPVKVPEQLLFLSDELFEFATKTIYSHC